MFVFSPRASDFLPNVAKPPIAGTFQLSHLSCSDSLFSLLHPLPPPRILWPPSSPQAGWLGGGIWVLSQLSYPSASPAGVVWLPSSELGHIVFSFGASVMTCRHQEKFQVTFCYTLIPLPQVLNFYLKYRKVGKCAGSAVWHWLLATGKSSNVSEPQFLRCEAGTIVFSLEDVVKIELFFICLVAQGRSQ